MSRATLATILWLRWRLTRNQWARSGGLGAVIAALIAAAVILLAPAGFVGGFVGGLLGLAEARPIQVWAVWLGLTVGFLLLWLIGLLNELQRSEAIDLQRLLHLPVALGQIFVVNYVASHLAFSIVLLVPAMLGLTLGLAISRGPAMVLLAPLALGFVFMITAWTYCLRGWLATLMANPRRRRAMIVGITAVVVLLVQGPNIYFNILHRSNRTVPGMPPAELQRRHEAQERANRTRLDQFLAAQKFIPPLWLPAGAGALAEGRVLPAFLGTLGCLAIGGLGLRRAYRGTLRFYQGDAGGNTAAKVKPPRAATATGRAANPGRGFLELELPGVPGQAAALALATFRSLLRAPEVKMAWASSFIVTLILGGALLFRAELSAPEAARPFLATGAAVFSIFLLVQFFANQFGFDRDGFRALVLSPADRRLILLGKNLAFLPVGGFSVVLLALVFVQLRLPPSAVLATLFQLAALLLLAGIAGNLLSILVPYRVQAGTMRPTKMPALTSLVMILCHSLFPVAMVPVFLPPLAEWLWQRTGRPAGVPVNLLFSVVLVAVAGLAYWRTLAPLGRLLQRRETKILSVVTVDVD